MGHGSSRIPRATIRMGAIGMVRERASISARRMRTRVHTLILHNRILHNGLCPPCSRKEMKNEPPLPSTAFSPLDSSTPPRLFPSILFIFHPDFPFSSESYYSLRWMYTCIYVYTCSPRILSVDRNLTLSLSLSILRSKRIFFFEFNG